MHDIGFTGSRVKPSELQLDWLRERLGFFYMCGHKTFHHGDCLGGDEAAHAVAQHIGYAIVIHPPTDDKSRAFLLGTIILPRRPYLDRNKDIVDSCGYLLALPKGPEVLRSGTWSTIRYAKKRGVPVSYKIGRER